MGKSQSHTSESFTVNGVDKYATFEDSWFAEGASRYAYQGKIYSVNGWWFERGQRCVVKLYKEEYCAKLNELAWRADKRASLKAQEMAELFNATYINTSNFARIEVLIPIISQIKTAPNHVGRKPVSGTVPDAAVGESGAGETRADVKVREGASVAIEYFLRGRYVEFLSNTYWVNTKEKSFVPVAFSHFTFHESKGEILVTDLQGVYNQKSYVFTDPAVHSMEKRGAKFGYYGPTDLGVYGVMKFFYDHKCNSLCKELLKPDMSNIPDYLKGDLDQAIEAIKSRSGSTYTYALLESGLTAERLQELHTSIARALAQSTCGGTESRRSKFGVDWEDVGRRLVAAGAGFSYLHGTVPF